MLTQETAINTVKEFVNSCNQQNIYFNKVILFGSAAKETTTQNSDIDLLLISDQFGYSKWGNLGLIARINKKFQLIEPHTFPTEYFLKSDPFINEIKKKQ
jgi:predicted nucleotidyltransferase